MSETRELLNIVIVGHVDHGKSTLVGRLLHDTGSLPKDRFDKVKRICKEQGKAFEYAFLMDAFEEEQKQGITIDVSRVFFASKKRDYLIIDTPGHKEFLKNMFSGASTAEVGIILIDAAEGIQEQSRQHAYLLHLLGITQIVVVVNKMDLIKCSGAKFNKIKKEYDEYLSTLSFEMKEFIPIVARTGANVCKRSQELKWYKGKTVVQILDSFSARKPNDDLPLRFNVQDVYKFDQKRILAGRVESGTLAVGDELIFSPSNKTGKVKSIEAWPRKKTRTKAVSNGMSAAFTLEKQIFVERGDLASHTESPPWRAQEFEATLFWLGNDPLTMTKSYRFRFGSQEVEGTIAKIRVVITADGKYKKRARVVNRHDAAELVIRTKNPVAFDDFDEIQQTGRFVIIDHHVVSGGGRATLGNHANLRETSKAEVKSKNISWHFSKVTQKEREERYQHKGAVIWLTGLSGAGKSTLAVELEKMLFNQGVHVFIIDGDNVRHGLNANLGFSPDDRVENIRRVGEVAKLFAEAGLVVIAAFISPYRKGRDQIRKRVRDRFVEVYVDCSLEVCEQRDVKGLYKKARTGEIKDFTGVSAPYEAPKKPEITLDTDTSSIDDCVAKVIEKLKEKKII